MYRRKFLGLAAGLTSTGSRAQTAPFPIIDAHIHLFDPRRPQGVPWPEKNNAALYRPALPDRYRKLAAPLGITGAVVIEASPWLEDNQWVLDIAATDSIVVGTVGDLEPGKPEFRKQLERFHRNPLFRGIRYGNLWNRDLGAGIANPRFVADIKVLVEAGLSLDTANPDPALIAAALRLSDKVPDLRIIVDHLPSLQPPREAAARRSYEGDLAELGRRPRVYVKLSAVLRRVEGRVPEDVSSYRPTLDHLWETFGQDRVLYGSDWPNSDRVATYPQVLKIVQEYFKDKGPVAAKKYFWKNSIAAYRWVKRASNQPQA